MHARVTMLQGQPDRADDVAAQLQRDDVPGFEQLDGFKGMTLMADRDSGRMIALTFWESQEAMRASEDAVQDARSRAAEQGGASTPRVEHYEVLFDTTA